MVTNPIWKDTEYTTSADTLTYTIRVDGTPIFMGRAFKYPDADNLVININRVCQNYLSNELPEVFPAISSTTTYYNTDAYRDFVLYDSNGVQLETFRFYYDWSYDDAFSSDTRSSTINGHYAAGMLHFNTIRDTVNLRYNNTISLRSSGDSCGDYAIYYLNSYGGWDEFLFEGRCKMMDEFTQYEYNKSFNNTTIQFEKGRYISEIQTGYELTTGWLNDNQSFNFARNLVGSNMAYLHNLRTGKISPIVIDEQDVEYKEYKSNGNHLIEYTIRVKESQNRIRK